MQPWKQKPKAKHIQSTVNKQVKNRWADNKKNLASNPPLIPLTGQVLS